MLSALVFDGNWVDCGAVLQGFCVCLARLWKAHRAGRVCPLASANHFAQGVALFPQYVLVTCVFSSSLMEALADASRASLSVAGGYAVGAMIAAGSDPTSQKKKPRRQRQRGGS